MTYSDSSITLPANLLATLMHLSSDMKIKVISLLSKSLCDSLPKEESKATDALVFPTLPADFKVSDCIKNMGIKLPDDFDYAAAKNDMYEEFAK